MRAAHGYGDLPLLDLVGSAVAVNSDSRLRATARERGWPVLDGPRARRLHLGLSRVPAVLGLARSAHRRAA